MRFRIVSLFPEIFDSLLATSLIGKARQGGLIEVDFVDPRDHAPDKHRTVDDTPYGGGEGMVLKPEPFVDAMEAAAPRSPAEEGSHRVLLCPQGQPLTQKHLRRYAEMGDVTLVCGRYEGFDERIRHFVDEEVSLGDFVLNGGEVAAMAIVDGVSRLVPGVIGNAASLDSESHGDGLLEYPQYTRPPSFRDLGVPEVLRSGDHGRIEAWRRQQMLLRTRSKRADLWRDFRGDARDRKLLMEAQGAKGALESERPDERTSEQRERAPAKAEGRSAAEDSRICAEGALESERPDERTSERGRRAGKTYIALLHHPVLDRSGRIVTTALTNLDLHDIARSSRTFGLAGYFVVTPLPSQQELAERIVSHWREGHGANVHEKRKEALELLEVQPDLDAAVARVEAVEGIRPVTVATSARPSERQIGFEELPQWVGEETPVVIILGTGWGLADEILDAADLHLAPVRGPVPYNHLSVRSAAAIMLDRCFGMRE